MNRIMRKYLYTILAGITYIIIHEGVHIMQALIFNIYLVSKKLYPAYVIK